MSNAGDHMCVFVQTTRTTALFSSPQNLKTFQDSPSHRILQHMHEALNIVKKQKLITQFACKSRDESFRPS